MNPDQAAQKPIKTKKISRQRHFLAAFFISFMWGTFGADRFYLGKYWTGLLKLVTFGGFGIWTLTDLSMIMGGRMTDKQGRPLLQFAEYKKFAYWTVLIFALSLGALVLITGIELIYSLNGIMKSLQGGGGIPGLNALNGGGLPPDLQQTLNN